METSKIIWDFLKLVMIIGIAFLSIELILKSIFKKEPWVTMKFKLLYFLISITTSILAYFFVYSGFVKVPKDIWQFVILSVSIIIAIVSSKLILKPYYQKKPWKNRIPHFIIGLTVSILIYLFLYHKNF